LTLSVLVLKFNVPDGVDRLHCPNTLWVPPPFRVTVICDVVK
jgi:hypothetical protein